MLDMMELFQYTFMQRALIAGAVMAVIAPLIGTFLVVKRYSLLADTLSHVSLFGVAIATLAGIHPTLGAFAASSIAAVGMERLRERRGLFGESVLALFLSGSLAFALLILSASHGAQVNLMSYLFGSITTVTSVDVVSIVGCGFLVIFLVAVFFKRFFLVAYDEEFAAGSGASTSAINMLLMLLAAVTVSLSMRMVGVLLIGALMVIPPLAASQLGKSFARTVGYAILFSLFAVGVGLTASFYLNVPSGAAIVVVALVLFGATCITQSISSSQGSRFKGTSDHWS